MRTRGKSIPAHSSAKGRGLSNPDNPNRLKPGAVFYITIDGHRQTLSYPTKRGKLPASKIRKIIDGVVALRKKPIFAK